MKYKMRDKQSNTPVIPVSSTSVSWSSSLERLPNIGIEDVEAFVSAEKSPIVKGYMFFVEGFIHEFQGMVMAVLISLQDFSLVYNAGQLNKVPVSDFNS